MVCICYSIVIVSVAVCDTVLQMATPGSSEYLLTADELAEAETEHTSQQQAQQERSDQLNSKGWSGTSSYEGAPLFKLSAADILGLEDQHLYPMQADTPRFTSKQILAGALGMSKHYVHAQYRSVFEQYVASATDKQPVANCQSMAHSRFAKDFLSFGKQFVAEGDPAVAAIDEVLANFTGPRPKCSRFCAIHGWCSHTLPHCICLATAQQGEGFNAARILRYLHPLAAITPQLPKRAPAPLARQKPVIPAMRAPAPAVQAVLAGKRKGVPSLMAPGPQGKHQKAVGSGYQGPAVTPVLAVPVPAVSPAVVPAAQAAVASFAAPAAAAPVVTPVLPAGSVQQAHNSEALPGQMVSFTELMYRQYSSTMERVLADKEGQLSAARAEVQKLQRQLQDVGVLKDRYRSERDGARAEVNSLEQHIQKLSASEAYYRQQVIDADNREQEENAQRSPKYAVSSM